MNDKKNKPNPFEGFDPPEELTPEEREISADNYKSQQIRQWHTATQNLLDEQKAMKQVIFQNTRRIAVLQDHLIKQLHDKAEEE